MKKLTEKNQVGWEELGLSIPDNEAYKRIEKHSSSAKPVFHPKTKTRNKQIIGIEEYEKYGWDDAAFEKYPKDDTHLINSKNNCWTNCTLRLFDRLELF